MRWRATAAILVALITAASCSSSDEDDSRSTTTTAQSEASSSTRAPTPTSTAPDFDPAAYAANLIDRPCRSRPAAKVTAECHWIEVPANWETPDGATIRLAVTVLRKARRPQPDPIVYLSGGPGYPGGDPATWAESNFLNTRDIIVYDQRGTGKSEPNMQCPEIEAQVVAVLGAAEPFRREQAAMRTAVRECRDRLIDEGSDLLGFSTRANAADLVAIRTRLGITQWNLLGISYGTRLAQVAMRLDEDGIRSVVLDSTYPLAAGSTSDVHRGIERAFDQLVAGCAALPRCARRHGNVADDLLAIERQYDATPYRATITVDDKPVDIVITGADIVAGAFNAMYDTDLIAALPGIADALLSGGSAIIDQLALQAIPFVNGAAEGMTLSTDCADSAPSVTEADSRARRQPGRLATVATLDIGDYCDAWEFAPADRSFTKPITSDIPTLVLSGTYDPITPTPGAQRVADSLPNAQFVAFEGFGHGIFGTTQCSTVVYNQFFREPGRRLKTKCFQHFKGPRFT